MDGVLEFLNKWVARPVAIIGAFITIVVTVQSIAVGDLQRIVSLFGLPTIELSVPPVFDFISARMPDWLTGLWQYSFVKVLALAFVVLSSALACGLWCLMFGRFSWIGLILIAPALLFSIWAPLHLYTQWFPDTLTIYRVSYEVGQNGAFERAIFTGVGAAQATTLVLAGILLLITTVPYKRATDDNNGPLVVYVIFGVVAGGALITVALQDATVTRSDQVLRTCATATTAQIDAHETSLRAFVNRQRPPATPNRGVFSNGGVFKMPWYAVRHGCTIEGEDGDGYDSVWRSVTPQSWMKTCGVVTSALFAGGVMSIPSALRATSCWPHSVVATVSVIGAATPPTQCAAT